MTQGKNIGFGIPIPPQPKDYDQNCPFYGNLPISSRILVAKVLSAKTPKNVTVEIMSRKYVSKYERYVSVRTKIKAHNPESIKAKEGDIVKIAQTRPISKTKNFVVVQILNEDENASN